MIDKRDLHDFKQQYPETIDCIGDLVEDGWDSLLTLTKNFKHVEINRIAACLLLDNWEVIYDIHGLNCLLAEQITASMTVFSNTRKMVANIKLKHKKMIERMFELVNEDYQMRYKQSHAESLRYNHFEI